ncbi:SH3 domain-containing protein [Paragemmobacter ruber]|uniref:SH3 domain-containing protein n=1 Tax=Paragemmobacter ruber TaxID=1985673 RepID=A0ABW9Y9Q6_9RHOB|nr:SH3 domain-containing protein [Rhodobacter ruber]NBE09336.1 SH3 domain-containing protein [Rhodobacter ruber]
MFRYLLFFGGAFYLVLLIGGEDRGQERMGLRGAYDIALAPADTTAEPTTADAPAPLTQASATPSDTLRILPAPDQAVIQPASLTEATPEPSPEPAFNDFNNPTVTLRYITADAANVRDAGSRNGAVIGRLERGEIVQVIAEQDDWVHIRIEGDGIDGYVHRRLISAEAPTLSTLTLFPAAD